MAALEALEKLLAGGLADESAAAEAVRLLRQARMTPDEGRAVELLLNHHLEAPLPEALLLTVASVLVDRGDDEVAARALSQASSSPALVLRADLLAHAGDVRAATALVERILLRDLDFPGARERHARWCACLGRASISAAPTAATFEKATAGIANRFEGPFLLLREVARGGAGTVFEAQDRDLGRRVALKIYHRPDGDRSQLAHEARVAVALSGPGVVRVFDVDIERGWLAMQWAPRGALGAHLRQEPGEEVDDGVVVDPSSFGRWARSLAGGLARVHAAGWAHLDVKPANVLIYATDEAALTDFGTARRFGEPCPPGSFGYLSPERLAGRASDARDDVYGFGRVLEDALDRAGAAEGLLAWRSLAASCTGADAQRPRDGAEILARISSAEPE